MGACELLKMSSVVKMLMEASGLLKKSSVVRAAMLHPRQGRSSHSERLVLLMLLGMSSVERAALRAAERVPRTMGRQHGEAVRPVECCCCSC